MKAFCLRIIRTGKSFLSQFLLRCHASIAWTRFSMISWVWALHPCFLAASYHRSADIVSFCFSLILKIRKDTGISPGGSLKLFSEYFPLLFIIKMTAFSFGRFADLPDQVAADLPGMGIFCHEALGFSKKAGKNAGGSIDHQLVPDSKSDIFTEFAGETCFFKEFGDLPNFFAGVGIFIPLSDPSDHCIAQSAVDNGMIIFPIASLGRRSDQDMGVVGKLPENILVARSVLQGQDQCILSDQIPVCRKGFLCDIGFREKDDQILCLFFFARKGCPYPV